MRRTICVGLAAAAAACSRPASAPMGRAEVASLAAPPPTATAKQSSAPDVAAQALPQLAYSYSAEIEAPVAAIAALLARHEALCRAAGPATCQVIDAQTSTADDRTRGALTVRAQPGWLGGLRDRLASDAHAYGGRLVASQTSTEDLTRSIVDTDAALRAKTLLASRLEQLLASRQGKLSDLLEAEEALAKTQGEIDAAKSELAVMRARVATSDLKIAYSPAEGWASSGAWRPVSQAAHGATTTAAASLAVLITVLAALAPFALVGALVWVIVRAASRRGIGRRRARERPPPPTA